MWKVGGIKIECTQARDFFFADGQGNQSKTEFFCSSTRYSEMKRDIGMGHKRSNDVFKQWGPNALLGKKWLRGSFNPVLVAQS